MKKAIFIGTILTMLCNISFAQDTQQLRIVDQNDLDTAFKDNYLNNPNGATKLFYEAFIEAQDLIVSGKLEQAKKSIAKLHRIKPLNKYEESRAYLIDYWYYGKVGETAEETEALRNLIPIGAGNIDTNIFVEAGIRLFKRQYNAQDYGSAIDTLAYLRKEKKSQPELDAIAPAVKKLDDIVISNQDITQQIKTDNNGKWNTKLLRKIFYIDKINGEVNSIDFGCEHKRLSTPYKSDSVIFIPEDWGNCSVKINATPNTTFHFIQLTKKPAQE